MNTLAVVKPNLSNEKGIEVLDSFYISFGGDNICIALLKIANDPQKDKDDLVLVEKIAISLNYRDRGIIILANDQLKKNDQLKYFPIGSEFSGRIVSDVASGIPSLFKGCLVIPNCNYQAELHKSFTGIPTNSSATSKEYLPFNKVLAVPETFNEVHVSAFSLNMQTAYSMIRKANLAGDETVLILGGSSSTALFILNSLKFKMSGLKITVVTTERGKVEKFKAMGALEVIAIDSRGYNTHKYMINLLTTCNIMSKYNIVFDTFSDLYLPTFIHSLTYYGKYITCGFFFQENPALFPSVSPGSFKGILAVLIKRNIQIIGNCLGETSDLQAALTDYSQNNYHHLIDKVFDFADYKEFINRTFFDKQRFGKVILKMNNTYEN